MMFGRWRNLDRRIKFLEEERMEKIQEESYKNRGFTMSSERRPEECISLVAVIRKWEKGKMLFSQEYIEDYHFSYYSGPSIWAWKEVSIKPGCTEKKK